MARKGSTGTKPGKRPRGETSPKKGGGDKEDMSQNSPKGRKAAFAQKAAAKKKGEEKKKIEKIAKFVEDGKCRPFMSLTTYIDHNFFQLREP